MHSQSKKFYHNIARLVFLMKVVIKMIQCLIIRLMMWGPKHLWHYLWFQFVFLFYLFISPVLYLHVFCTCNYFLNNYFLNSLEVTLGDTEIKTITIIVIVVNITIIKFLSLLLVYLQRVRQEHVFFVLLFLLWLFNSNIIISFLCDHLRVEDYKYLLLNYFRSIALPVPNTNYVMWCINLVHVNLLFNFYLIDTRPLECQQIQHT